MRNTIGIEGDIVIEIREFTKSSRLLQEKIQSIRTKIDTKIYMKHIRLNTMTKIFIFFGGGRGEANI